MMKPKEVVFFISSMGAGGAERQLSYIANELSKTRKIYIYTLAYTGAESFYKLASEVEKIDLSLAIKKKSFVNKVYMVLKRLYIFRKIILKHKKRGAVFVSFMDVMNMLCILASMGTGEKIIVSERSDPNHQPKKKWLRSLIDFSYKFSKAVSVQSKTAQLYFLRKGIKSKVIHNGFDFSGVELAEKSYDPKNLRFISVARLSNEKRVLQSAKKFLAAESKAEVPPFSFRIFGKGPNRAALERLIEKSGSITYEGLSNKIFDEMRSSDVLVLGSDYEGFPNVIVEALHCGLMVLTTETAGAKEIKETLKTERIVFFDDESFFKKLEEVMRSVQNKAIPSDFDMSPFALKKVLVLWDRLFEGEL